MNSAARICSHASVVGSGSALELRQQIDAPLVHRVEPSREHRLEQLFLAAEVIVHGCEIHAALPQ